MKTFKFGQLIQKEDICDRKKEIAFINKICRAKGRIVVYGPRRFGKTSVIKNVIVEDFLSKNKKALVIYADLFQLDSIDDLISRLRIAFEQALDQRSKIKTFIEGIRNYLKHFRIEISADPISGAPSVHLTGQYIRDERSLSELFSVMKNISNTYDLMLILDEFQDIKHVQGLEGKLRAEIQSLSNVPVILLGSKRHVLREIFQNESSPFYGFGTDVEFNKIDRGHWLPYMQERFKVCGIKIETDGVDEICNLMRDVPNAIQELCQWISLSGKTGVLTVDDIHKNLLDLINNKSSRYIEKQAGSSAKEKKVIVAVARLEPVISITSTKFVQTAGVSQTAIRATIARLCDQGVIDSTINGYVITDPIYKMFLLRWTMLGDK